MASNFSNYTEEETNAALSLLFLSKQNAEHIQREAERIQEVQQESTSFTDHQRRRIQANRNQASTQEASVQDVLKYNMDVVLQQLAKIAMQRVNLNDPQLSKKMADQNGLRKRLEEFINEDEVGDAKYHENMKRAYPEANRTPKGQLDREKNNEASRLCRVRLRNAEHNLKNDANALEEKMIAKRIHKALMLNYCKVLHKELKISPVNFNQPVEKVLLAFRINWQLIKKAKQADDLKKAQEKAQKKSQ